MMARSRRPAEASSAELARGEPLTVEQAKELHEIALFPEMNPGPVCRLDLDATVLRANRAALAMLGQDLMGRSWKEVLPSVTEAVWERVVTGGERLWVEAQVDGVHLGFTMLRARGSSQVFVYGADITALKDAERQLAELARFPEMNPGPVLRLDRDGVIRLANRAARALFGGEGLVGRSWREICPGITPEFWSRALQAEAPLDHETQLAGRQMLFTHTHDEQGEQLFVYGADLSELKSAERALRQSERMATLGTLAAGVAHELNNPSAAVQRAAAHLQDAFSALQQAQLTLSRLGLEPAVLDRLAELDRLARTRASGAEPLDPLTRSDRETDVELWLEDQGIEDGWDLAPALVSLRYGAAELDELAYTLPREHLAPIIEWMGRTYPVYLVLEEVHHGASRISEIVTALKAYSYVGQAPAQRVDVNQGIRHTLIILHNKLKRGVHVELELDPELPGIQAYGGELNQVWTNLIDNAADAMEGSGRLTLRTAVDGDWIRVDVEDDGPGIPEDIQSRIFDPFFTTKDPGQGTGLGLNTTFNTIVKKHGGRIELQSRPGRTCFIIRLPQVLAEDPSTATAIENHSTPELEIELPAQ